MKNFLRFYLICIGIIIFGGFGIYSCQKGVRDREIEAYRQKLEYAFNPDIIDVDKSKKHRPIIIEESYPDFDYSKNYPRTQTNPDIYCFGGVSVKDIFNDLYHSSWEHGYSDKFLYKDIYKDLVEDDDIYSKAAFMTLIDYYYWYSINFAAEREMITRGKYIDNNIDEVNGNTLMNDCINRSLDVLTAWQNYEVKMHIIDHTDEMDLGTYLNIGYWINIGDSKYLENTYMNMFSSISSDYYDSVAEILLISAGRTTKNGYTYEVCGSPLDLILGYRGEFSGYIKEDLQIIDYNKLKKRFEFWLDKLEKPIIA